MAICLWVKARLCPRAFGIDLTPTHWRRVGHPLRHHLRARNGLRGVFGTRSITGAKLKGECRLRECRPPGPARLREDLDATSKSSHDLRPWR